MLPKPRELAETVFTGLEDKAKLALGPMILLGVLAGAYIGIGGLFATVALAGAEALAFGTAQVIAGLVFSVGLVLVLVSGAELFTGNTLMVGPVATGRIKAISALRALGVVYIANFLGSLLLAAVVYFAAVHEAGDGAVGRAALDLGVTKLDKSFGAAFASGIVANMLVCLAVWVAQAGKTVTAKFFGLVLPIAAFVAAGLEHSVANMYLLPYAYFVQFAEASTAVTLSGVGASLLAATLGNIVGGSLIALAYSYAYIRR